MSVNFLSLCFSVAIPLYMHLYGGKVIQSKQIRRQYFSWLSQLIKPVFKGLHKEEQRRPSGEPEATGTWTRQMKKITSNTSVKKCAVHFFYKVQVFILLIIIIFEGQCFKQYRKTLFLHQKKNYGKNNFICNLNNILILLQWHVERGQSWRYIRYMMYRRVFGPHVLVFSVGASWWGSTSGISSRITTVTIRNTKK